MKTRILFIFFLLFAASLYAQYDDKQDISIVNGYERTISGTDFYYHSSIPVARESLLIRATDGNSSMEWETDTIPQNPDAEFVSFVWLAGIGSSPGKVSFSLALNGTEKFTFWADGADEWNLKNEDGSSLRFKKDMVDQYGDRFGFMFLTLPVKSLKAGSPLSIKVIGGKFDKTSWYMTFKLPLESGLNFKALPAISEIGGKQYQLGVAGVLYFGEPNQAKIFVDGTLVKDTTINFGYNYIKVQLPLVDKKTTLPYTLEVTGKIWTGNLEINPVRHWRVNFVQHSHTDIGYTRSQTEILAEHLRFIDYALDYCDNTDNYPDDAKFRWTCEASWAVDEYLKCRPQTQIDRLKKRVAEGRIEITGMYFNFDELPDEQTLAASLQPIKRFKTQGLEVKTAMQNDVNGIGWSLNESYNDLGVKYLNMGTHGHRALICFDKPTLFWWESPSGKRMLAFRAEHYMTGNTVFKIHTGDFNVFEDELLSYLSQLEAKGYAYDLISIQHSGYLTDNSPPSTLASDMIRKWNEKYTWPKLKTASATEFFEVMETKHGSEFQVIRGSWPDWWTDGFGASAREVAATREAQSDLIATGAGLTMAALSGSRLPEKTSDQIEAINSALLFYTEHTVGYHASVSEPFHQNTMEQRAIKESYAWEASRKAKMLGEETMGILQGFVEREKDPSILVFNTLNWKRSGLLTVYIDHQILPRYTDFTITDQAGNLARAQAVEYRSDGTYWAIWADDIPAFGYKKYVIKLEKNQENQEISENNTVDYSFENEWYNIAFDPKTGTISSLKDKELNLELIDQHSPWKFGQFIYELLDNRAQMESKRLDNFTREAPDSVWFESYETGQVWNTFRFKANTRAANRAGSLIIEFRIFNCTKRIDIAYLIEKKLLTDPEGIYIAFPFALENGQLAFDVAGGEIRAGIDQIPGSANDWNTVQSYARLSNPMAQIILCSPEIPLMQFGGINTGRYTAGAKPESTHIFGWPMNNYWTTNFNANQHGGTAWTYTISSSKKPEMQEAARFGSENRTPLLTRVLPGGGKGNDVWEKSLISGWNDNLLLISAFPDEDGKSAVFQLREISGKPATIRLQNNLTGKVFPCKQVDVTGQTIQDGNLKIKPFETKFIHVEF